MKKNFKKYAALMPVQHKEKKEAKSRPPTPQKFSKPAALLEKKMTPAQRGIVASTLGPRTGGFLNAIAPAVEKFEAKPALMQKEEKVVAQVQATQNLPLGVAFDGSTRKGAVSMRRSKIWHTDGAGRRRLRDVVIIKNREFVMPITGTSALTQGVFLPVNPGNGALCPWLQSIALNYDEFTIIAMNMQFLTEAANTERGRIVMAFDYESTDNPPTTRTQSEDIQGAVAFAPWKNSKLHWRPSAVQLPSYYCSGSSQVTAASDPRITTPANFYLMTMDFSNTTTAAGELWISYEVAFYEANFAQTSVTPPAGGANMAMWISNATTQAAQSSQAITTTYPTPGQTNPNWPYAYGSANQSYWVGGGAQPNVTNAATNSINIILPFATSGGLYYPQPGSYLISIIATFGASTGTPGTALSGSGVTGHAYPVGSGNQLGYQVSASGVVFVYRVDVTGVMSVSLPAVVLTGWTGGTAGNNSSITVTKIQAIGVSQATRSIEKDDVVEIETRKVITLIDGETIVSSTKSTLPKSKVQTALDFSKVDHKGDEKNVPEDPTDACGLSARKREGSTESMVTVALPRALAAQMDRDGHKTSLDAKSKK